MLLEIDGLSIFYGREKAVDSVSLALGAGERVALAGESGSGKSTLGRAIIGLLPPGARSQAGRFLFAGQDLASMNRDEWRSLRGKRIGLVLQDARYALTPTMRIGDQMEEAIRVHEAISSAGAKARCRDLLIRVRLDEPDRVMRAFPHQLSGGMGQRAMIALALSLSPEMLIADEPTSALDQETAESVAELLREQSLERGMALLLITHDLNLAQRLCSRVAVMKDGAMVACEDSAALSASRHPYVRRLLDAVLAA
jgi:ABC-type glutathione transport system ATPase component